MRFNHHPYAFRVFIDSLIARGIKNGEPQLANLQGLI